MRYFVHRDGLILGPYAPGDLAQAAGLHEGTLVCEEAAGGREGDWVSLGQISELSGLPLAASTGLLEGGLPSAEPGELERMELDTLGAGVDAPEGEWAAELIEEAGFRRRWEETLSPDLPQSLQEAQSRVRDLTAQLAALKARLLAMEAQQGQLLRRSESVPAAAEPAPAAAPELPSFKPRQETPAEAPAVPGEPAEAAPPGPEPTFKIAPPKTFKTQIKLADAGAFRTVPKPEVSEAPPAPAAPPVKASVATPPVQPFEWSGPQAEVQTPAVALPEAKKAEPLAAVEPASQPQLPPALPPVEAKTVPAAVAAPAPLPTLSAPQPMLTPPPALAAPTPTLAAPQPTLSAPQTAPVLQPPPLTQSPFSSLPLPTPQPSAPATAVFSGGTAPLGILTPSRSNAEPAPTPVPTPGTQEVLARLAKPQEQPTAAPKPRKGPKAFIIVGVVLLVVVAVVGYKMLGDSKDLKMMVNMESETVPAEEAPVPPAPEAAPQAPQEYAPAITQPPQPGATAAPAPAPDFVPDPGQAAIALVKNYPLDGERGTVEKWLQFSYAADPGTGNREEWTAGPVEASTYLVQYRVIPGAASSVTEIITLLFEADTARGTVQGKNPRARELLAGGAPSAPKPARAGKKRSRKAVKPKEPKEVPLLPLPTESELLPPGEDDASFRQDTVEGGL